MTNFINSIPLLISLNSLRRKKRKNCVNQKFMSRGVNSEIKLLTSKPIINFISIINFKTTFLTKSYLPPKTQSNTNLPLSR